MKVKSVLFVGAAAAVLFLMGCCSNGNNASCNGEKKACSKDSAACASASGQCPNKQGCANDKPNEEPTEGAPIFEKTFSGTFEGTLPGADNSGCTYTVVFGEDGSCSVTRTYQKEGVKPSTVKGTYTLGADPTMVTCTLTGDEPIYFMRLTNDELAMVDANFGLPAKLNDYKLMRK